MIIYIDMDDICVDLLHEWLITLNNIPGVIPKTEKDIVNWDMKLAYPMLTPNQIYRPLYDADMWDRIQPVEDAYKYLKKLIKDGHEVYIATASYPNSYSVKTEHCLLKHFDFLTPKNLICIHDKHLLKGDILFDDYHENLRNFDGIRILRNKPYNMNCDEACYHIRIDTWKEFYEICKEADRILRRQYHE